MFGHNPIRKIDRTEDSKLAIQEVFYTLQGEGPFSGTPAIFIRLAGCHLACTFCDTEFESNIDKRMSVSEIMTEVWNLVADLSFVPMFVITGGEPLRQDLSLLLYQLRNGFTEAPIIQIETAGNIWHPLIEEHWVKQNMISLVCSPKTKALHPLVAQYCKHYKYIVTARNLADDGLPTWGTQRGTMYHEGQIARPPKDAEDVNIWLSPCDEKIAELNAANLKAAVESAMKHNYRLSLQMHKTVGLP